jgi:ankyrin repeat protein
VPDPSAAHDVAQRAAALVRSACSSDPRPARALLAADPALGRHDIACACVTGEAEHVGRVLSRSPDLATAPAPPLDWPPILYACFSRLLRAGPGWAAGIVDVVRRLLDAGADPNAAFDHEGWLQAAVYGAAGIANNAELTRMLLDAGADPNDHGARRVGEALYHACEFPDPACAAALIDAGTRRSVVDYCLGRALNFPYPEMVEMFCSRGARPSAGSLHQSVWRQRPVRTVRALLDAGAPVDVPDDGGYTALRVATRWGRPDVSALLLERGADPGAVTGEDEALGAFMAGAATMPDAPGGVGEMLFMAVQGDHARAARRLLDAGADPNGTPGDDDAEPLGQACWRGYPEIVRELVARGAQTQFASGGSAVGAVLHGSQHCGHPEGGPTMRTVEEIPREPYAEVLRILLDAGAAVPEQLWPEAPAPGEMMKALLTGADA